jgi:hypothetical protein
MNKKDKKILIDMIREASEKYFEMDPFFEHQRRQIQQRVQAYCDVADALDVDIGDAADNPEYREDSA